MGVIAGIGAAAAGLAGMTGGMWINERNKEFAEEMASSQYQRSVADMKAAGLNPNAVFGSGGGSQAAAPQGQESNVFGNLGASAQQIIGAQKEVAATDLIHEEQKLKQATTDVTRANAKAAQSNAEVVERENTAYKKILEQPGGELVAAQKRYGGSDIASGAIRSIGTALASTGNAFGGTSSAKQAGEWFQNKFGSTGAGPNHPDRKREKYGGKR